MMVAATFHHLGSTVRFELVLAKTMARSTRQQNEARVPPNRFKPGEGPDSSWTDGKIGEVVVVPPSPMASDGRRHGGPDGASGDEDSDDQDNSSAVTMNTE